MEWLASKGAQVFVPVGHSPDVDLIASFGERLLRVEVKTSTHCRGGRWGVLISTRGGNQSWNGLVKYFDPRRCDFLFVHVGDGRRWFIPTTELEARSGLTLGGSRYAEFEIDPGRPLAAVRASGFLESKTARGSVEVGESSGPVKSVPLAEWVRIPPPPSSNDRDSASPVRYERTRVSPRHQVTIPSVPFKAAGLQVGDRLHGRADGPGRVILERIEPGSNTLPLDGLDQ
jgi:hypothetical protein